MIGVLGSAVFTVSSWRVFTFRGFNRGAASRIEEHNVIGKKAKLEFVAPGLETISFNIRLDRFLGVAPESELARLRQSRDEGQIVPLIIGGKYLGRWVITDLAETHTRHDGFGLIVVAEVQVTIKEVADGDLLSNLIS